MRIHLSTLWLCAFLILGCADEAIEAERTSNKNFAEEDSRPACEIERTSNKNIAEEYLKQAIESEQAGDKSTAKNLYSKAAAKGSPEAHFVLAYKDGATRQEKIYHLSEAAKQGHGEALDYALDNLLFRANSFKTADPQRALDLYYKAKKANPGIELFDEKYKLKIMRMCAEPGEFDGLAFLEKYGLQPEGNVFYHVWEIAEEASKGGRFGEPDPELILQLVARGGSVPAEFMNAVKEVHKNWKNGEAKEFNICDHITSGYGMGFAARRADEKDRKIREAKLIALAAKLDAESRPLLRSAYDTAVKFIEMKAGLEEGHGGSGRAAWVIGSEMDQKNECLKMISDIHGGFITPTPLNNFNEADRILNKTYRNVMRDIKAAPNEYSEYPSANDLRKVQRLWIPYRDASAKLFSTMNPATDERLWKTWLTEVRTKQLQEVPVQTP